MRLSFFDPPRPAELLYSALARYGAWKGLDSPKAIMADLFGRPSTTATVDLPNTLDELFRRAPVLSRDQGCEAIEGHTLFRYYAAFQPAERAEVALRAMHNSAGNLHLILGVSTFRTGRPRHLQFCPSCVCDMIEKFGEPHWRLDQQLPGVLVCPDHGRRLRRSNVDLLSTNRHAFVAATSVNCGPHCEPVTAPMSDRIHDLALRLARASRSLALSPSSRPTREELRDHYRSRLARAGLIRGRQKIDQAGLRDAFLCHSGALLERLQGVDLRGASETWLHSIVRTSSGAHPPLQHLLLRLFLDDNAGLVSMDGEPQAVSAAAPATEGAAKVDWTSLDLRYAASIRICAQQLTRASPPVRVTLAAIERSMGRRDWLVKRRSKLPKSSRAIAEETESVDAFRLRRLRWHVARCASLGIDDPWIVLRRAGLPHRYAALVRSEMFSSAVTKQDTCRNQLRKTRNQG